MQSNPKEADSLTHSADVGLLNSSNKSDKKKNLKVVTFNIGSFISLKLDTVPDSVSEKKFIEDFCRKQNCYNNTINFIQKLVKSKNVSILGFQEFRVLNNTNSDNTQGDFIIKTRNQKLDGTSLRYSMKSDTEYSYEIRELTQNYKLTRDIQLGNVMPHKKAILGIVEGKFYYEAVLTCFDEKICGDVINYGIFNIVDNDIRPCLIIETANYILINLHAPWEQNLYNLQQIDHVDFEESNKNHIIRAGQNLFNKIKEMIKSLSISTSKNFIFMGDFNDTYGLYKNNNLFYKRQLHWSSGLHTCCYSDSGSTMNKAGGYENNSPSDHIISTLQVKNTYMPVLDNGIFIMISDNRDLLLNKQRLEHNPMSDHQPLLVELTLPDEVPIDIKEELPVDKEKTNKKKRLTKRKRSTKRRKAGKSSRTR
jgi:hypothetical protein